MKLLCSILAASVMCVSMAGCNQPNRMEANPAAIKVTPIHATMMTGETVRLTAQTMNLVGVSTLKWQVSPTTATITPDKDNGLSAIFSANQPGGYLVTAAAQKADGSWVSSDANITVNGMARPAK